MRADSVREALPGLAVQNGKADWCLVSFVEVANLQVYSWQSLVWKSSRQATGMHVGSCHRELGGQEVQLRRVPLFHLHHVHTCSSFHNGTAWSTHSTCTPMFYSCYMEHSSSWIWLLQAALRFVFVTRLIHVRSDTSSLSSNCSHSWSAYTFESYRDCSELTCHLLDLVATAVVVSASAVASCPWEEA